MVPHRICDPGHSRRLAGTYPLSPALVDHPGGEVSLVLLKPQGVLEACLYASDLEASKAFYRDALGLVPFAEVEGRHVFFRCGEVVFLLFNPEETSKPGGDVPAHGARGPGHIAFAVQANELDEWPRQLAEQGIAIEAEITWPGGGRSLYFRDPADNSLELATPQTWGLRGRE